MADQPHGFWVDDFWVQPELSEIVKDGKTVQLEPKVMALLELFASQPGKVFSRQDLEDALWHGTIVGYDALSKAVTKLRVALGDDKKNPHYIQTISKKGYCLIARVAADNPLKTDDPSKAADSRKITNPPAINKTSNPVKIVAGGLLLIIAITVALLLILPNSEIENSERKFDLPRAQVSPVIGKPLIVVLPFRNISPKEADGYLADGITSDLITDLSKLSALRVMALNAAFAFKDLDVSPENARREFNASYMLSGEVNKVGPYVRINVHLTDVKQGNILWADRYNRQFTDIFKIQDEVAQKIVQSLSLTLTNEEKQRIARRYTNSLQAYDYFLRGQSQINMRTAEDNLAARELYNKAINLDPNFGRAYSGLALTYAIGYVRQWPSGHNKPLEKALQLSETAIKLDRDLPESYWVAAYVYGQQKRADKAIESLNQALILNPNYADAYAMLGWVNISIGKPELAFDYLAKALLLNPIGGYLYEMQHGRAHYFMGDYDLALTYFTRAHQGNPVYIDAMLYMAATYVSLKRYDDASWMLAETKHVNSNFDTQIWVNSLPILDEKFIEKLQKDLIQAEKFATQNDN